MRRSKKLGSLAQPLTPKIHNRIWPGCQEACTSCPAGVLCWEPGRSRRGSCLVAYRTGSRDHSGV